MKKRTREIIILILVVFGIFIANSSFAQTFYSQGSSTFDDIGNWNDAIDGSGVNPGTFDLTSGMADYVIRNTHTITAASFPLTIHNLTIEDGGVYQNGNQPITLNGVASISGSFEYTLASTATFMSAITVESTGSYSVIANVNSTINFHGDIINRGIWDLAFSVIWNIQAPLNIQNQSASDMNFGQNASGLGFINANLTILDFAGGGNINFYSNTSVTLANGVTFTNQLGAYPATSRFLNMPDLTSSLGVGTFVNAANAVVKYRRKPTTGSGITYDLSATDNLFVYSENTNYNILDVTYYHLRLDNGGVNTNTLQNDAVINGNLTINSPSILDANGLDIEISGSWNNFTGVTGLVNGGTVEFNGTSINPQVITGDTDFDNLIINNTGSSNTVRLNANASVLSTLSMSNGILQVDDGAILALGAGAAITGVYSSTLMIEVASFGVVRKYFDSDGSFAYPVGTPGVYTPAVISLNPNTLYGGAAGTRYIDMTPIATEEPNVVNSGLSLTKYWTVNSVNLSAIDALLVFGYDDSEALAGDESTYQAGYYDGVEWTVAAGVSAPTNTISIIATGSTTLAGNYTAGESGAFITAPFTTPFITTWQSDNSGMSPPNEIVIPTIGSGYNYDIYWEEIADPTHFGTATGLKSGTNIFFGTPGTYRVEITGSFPRIYFNNSGDKDKLLTIEQWGDGEWASMNNAFSGCTNLSFGASIDNPNLSSVTDMSNTFNNATSFNGDISSWDMSTVMNISGMFQGATSFNQNIGGWNVGLISDMSNTFSNATLFDQDLGGWDLTSIGNMGGMLDNSGLSVANYDATLIGWEAQGPPMAISFTAIGLSYCTAEVARNSLSGIGFNWDLTDDGLSCPSANPNPPHIYWSENIGDGLGGDDEIHRTDLEGNNFEQYYSGFGAEISGMAIDTLNNRLYWTDASRAEIVTGEIGPDELLSGPDILLDYNPVSANSMADLALDVTAGHIYFTHGNAETGALHKIGRVNIDGSADVELIDLGTDEEPFGIDLDLANGKIYYTTNFPATGVQRSLWRADLDGSNVELIYQDFGGVEYFRDVKIDPINQRVYWSSGAEDTAPGTIFSNDINEAAPFTTPDSFTFAGEPRGIDLDLVNNKIYWVCRGANNGATPPQIMRASLDGSFIESVFTVTIFPAGFPPGPPGSSFIALDLRGVPEPEISVFNGPDSTFPSILDAQPTAIDFGAAVQGTDITRTFTIENVGNEFLDINDIVVSGTGFSAGFFSITTLPQGNSLTFDITLSGASISVFNGSVSIDNTDADEDPFTFNITGAITATPEPEIATYLGSDNTGTVITDEQTMVIDYGSEVVTSDIVRTFAVENIGTADLTLSSITMGGDDFVVSSIPTTVVIGATQTFTITLSGTTAGVFNDVVTIASDDSDENPFTFNVTGQITGISEPEINVFVGVDNTGTAITDSQTSAIDIGSVINPNDIIQAFAIENTGTVDLNVSSITVSGTDYTVNSSINTIAAGVTESFSITLSGTQVGTFNTTVTIVNNDTDENPFTFEVTRTSEGVNVRDGNDNSGTVIVSNQEVDIGSTIINEDIDKIFVIENLSSNALTINSVISDNPVFEVIDAPMAIGPTQFAQFTVRLIADQVGVYNGNISVSTSLNDFTFAVIGEVLTNDQTNLNIYNVVTPNGDDVHDFLKIGNIINFPNNQVIIYNRWGDKVFELNGYNNMEKIFNGISNVGGNKELDTGNYYYAIDKKDGSKKETGFLLLKR